MTIKNSFINIDELNIIKNIKVKLNIGKKNNNDTKAPYYFNNYKKHVTIYKNGNGIIINSCNLIVTNKTEVDKIYRRLNIEDGMKDKFFPSLDEMLKVAKSRRFNNFGFWFYSDNDIIRNVTEYYWSDTDKYREDQELKENKKELRWTFDLNNGKIEENKAYQIVYVISIPGLYPISNGCFKKDKANARNSIIENSSQGNISQEIKDYTYIVSFEDGIELEQLPKCEICKVKQGKNESVKEEKEYNLLFTRYIFKKDNPIYNSVIKVSWKFKEKNKK